jgi:hypothetical protein
VLHLRARSGALGTPTRPGAARAALLDRPYTATVADRVDTSTIPTRVTPVFQRSSVAGTTVDAMIYVDTSALTWIHELSGIHKCSLDLMVVLWSASGGQADQRSSGLNLELKDQQYRESIGEGLVGRVALQVRTPGVYRLYAVVRDTLTGRLGSASQVFEAPNSESGELMLSSILVDAKEGNRVRNSPGVRKFRGGETMVNSFQVLNATLDEQKRTQFACLVRLVRDGREVFTGRQQKSSMSISTDPKIRTATSELKLGTDLVPGSYWVEITVTDLLATGKPRQSTAFADFEIVE